MPLWVGSGRNWGKGNHDLNISYEKHLFVIKIQNKKIYCSLKLYFEFSMVCLRTFCGNNLIRPFTLYS